MSLRERRDALPPLTELSPLFKAFPYPSASPSGTAAIAVSPRAKEPWPYPTPPDSGLRTNMIPVLRFTARQPPPTTPPPANPAGASGWTANAPRRLCCHRRPSVDGARRGTTSRADRRLLLQSRRNLKRPRHVERKMWVNK